MIGKSQAVLLALLLALPTAFLGAAIVTPAFAQPNYTAWLKIVTASWDGAPYVAGAPPVQPTGVGFADRYNATNVCVELYKFKNPSRLSPAPLDSWEGPIRAGSPNGTGFIRVSWPSGWENVTIIVKAKSYQGDCIGEGNPFRGIIVYWLTVNPTPSFLSKFGFSAFNSTINDDGIENTHGGPFNWNIFPPLGSGPVDNVNYASGPITFQINHNDPQRAWLARAAYIFKLFHEHTWYATDDVLTYATIFIYDTDHTDASSTQSLIQAAITGDDGQSRYTREIYPRSAGVGSGKFAQNRLVPIPLQTINLGTREPFEGGIPDPEDNNGFIEAPHLNATKRVWWETVLVNQTFYVGNEYNQTGGPNAPEYATDPATGKIRPLFGAYPSNPSVNPTITQGGITGVPAGPFSLVLNETVYIIPPVLLPTWEGTDTLLNTETVGPSIANFENNTVFYARFCVQDADLKIQHPEVGDKLVGAGITLNFKTAGDESYYLSHSIHETDESGCVGNPHKWPGYLDQFSKFARFPNGTNWGLRGSLNASYFFNPADDISPAWRPGGYFEQAWGGDWRGPWINAGRNWSALIPEITYMKTRTLSDDPKWGGFEVQVTWKGGSRNNYGGQPVLVDSIRVRNPYAIAALYNYEDESIFGEWVFPYTVLANNKLWLQIHSAASVTIGATTINNPKPTMLEIMGPFSLELTGFDSTTGTFDVTIAASGFVVVNNATDPEQVVDWSLSPREGIVIDDGLVTFKKHDITSFFLAFEAGQGQADRGADGRDDYTSVDGVSVDGGPFEVEFWPGPPGSGTVRALISGHDIDVCILPNNLNTCPNIRDFTGALLLKGPPRIVNFISYGVTADDVSGEFETDQGPTTFDYTVTVNGGGETVFNYLRWGDTNPLLNDFTVTLPRTSFLNLDYDNDGTNDDNVTISGSVIVDVYPVDLHYAWREDFTGALRIVDATITAEIDLNNDRTVDATATCTIAQFILTPGDVRSYRDPDTGAVTITATVPATATCTDRDTGADLSTRAAGTNEDMDVSLQVTFTITGTAITWPSFTFTSGSVTVTGTVDFDDDGVSNFITLPITFGRNIASTNIGTPDQIESDLYSDIITATCTVSGTIPPVVGGTSPASVTCTGTATLNIDIHNDDSTEITQTIPIAGSGTVIVTRTSPTTVTVSGSVPITGSPPLSDLDNDGVADDAVTISKTLSINVAGSIDLSPPIPDIDVTSPFHTLSGNLIININNIPPINNVVINNPGSGTITDEDPGELGTQIRITVPPVVSGKIYAGTATGDLTFLDTGSEQVLVLGSFEFEGTGEVDDTAGPVNGFVSLFGLGSIDNLNLFSGDGFAYVSFTIGGQSVSASGTFTLTCLNVGNPFISCTLSIVYDGTIGGSIPISGTLVIDSIVSTESFSDSFFGSLDEAEELFISGTAPAANNLIVGDDEYTSDELTLNGGILGVGPIVKAKISDLLFSDTHRLELDSLVDTMTLSGTAVDTTIIGSIGLIPVSGEQSFSITLEDITSLDITSFVVPLPDLQIDDRHLDDRLFGGYDDFALTGTGLVYITAWVHDIAWKPVDNMGDTLPASNTAVTLIRYNGPSITRASGSNPDQFQGNLAWSYSQWAGAETGYAIFYQLPGDQAYGITVTYEGSIVYDEPHQIEKLVETVIDKVVTKVFKLKLVFVDCEGQQLDSTAYVRITSTSGFRYQNHISDAGALDLIVAGGDMTIHGLWWKGVWVGFTEAKIGDRTLTLNPDGSLTITLDSNIDSPIKLTALINDFIFTTWDFNQDNRIPRLNITLTWVGEHPLTGSRMYFLETMDPSGDTNTDKFNTTLTFSQFLRYDIDHFFGGISRSNGLKTYGDVRYIFYKMPSTLYNITVTTVTTGDPETEQTPGNSKWPGRDVPVDYEIKIDWTSHSSPPSIRKTPEDQVNDRVVLRVYMSMGGQFVTDPNLNPIGNATLYKTCGPVRIDLLTWAHTFKQRIVDGDFDYLNEARRIGNATYHIVNDNGVNMEMYIPAEGVFSSLFVSKWTEDTLLTTWLKADSQHSSNIWWNGTYRKQDLTFYSYVYPLEFTRGEQPWARFYDKAGLTGSGWLTTQKGPLTSPGGDVRPGDSFLIREFFNPAVNETANGKWPTHNFTVVGNEGLWNQQRWRWEQAVAAGAVEEISTPFKGKRYIEVPTRPTTLVFEKEVVTVPIPVGFITLSLKDEDLARAIPYAVVELSIYSRPTRTTPPWHSSTSREFSAVYKVGREGNLTLLYPTQEMMENIISSDGGNPYVINYTLTVFWYLNSSIVYKDAFNLTKRGYSVDKVAIADVTFVLAISANKDRPVKDLYARIWWLNVTDGNTVFPGRITVDHARRTWTYTAVPETRGAAKWTTGQLTLPWLPTSERFTKSDWDLVFDSSAGRWVYDDVTRSWDIPYPSYEDGRMIDGWPYNPVPTGYDRRHPHLTNQENSRIQYRISVWSDQLPIDPSSPKYNNGAWQRDHYELVWRIPAQFPDAWMLFGHPPFDITFYRGTTGTGQFQPIPGYALTRTWTATPTPGSKVVAIKLNATDVDIPVFWQVGDYELGSYDCGPLLGYIVKGRIVPPLGATFAPKPIDAVTTAGTITVGDKTVNICISGKPVGLVTVTSGDTPSTVIWGGSTLVIDEVSPPPSIWYNDGTGQAGADNPNRGTTSNYWRNWVSQAIDPLTGQPVNLHVGDQLQVPGVDLGIQYMGYGRPYEGVARTATVTVVSNDPDNRAHRPFIKMFEFQNVSARITDFNGRPLPGAFYQIIDAQTGKSAAWSYAGPDGRIVPMPIRKPGGVFIQRVLYLGQGANGEPTWPVNSFARWPIAYDSRDDETTQETQKPDIPLGFAYTAEAGPWPTGDGWFRADVCRHAGDGSYNYTAGVLEALASCPPAGWGRSFDVITRIFDLRIRFVYGDAQRPADPAYVFSAPSLALPDDFIIRGQGAIFEAKRLARSSYDIVALWPDANGEEVGRRTFDVSRTNVGTVEGTVVLALRDLSFNVVDRQGRPVAGARVSVSPNLVREQDIQLRPDSIFTILRVPDGRTYDFTVEWTSPYGTTARAAVRDTPAGLQSRGSIVIPVDDVTLTVVDFDGRPVAGAAIRFGGQQVGSTDSQGVVIIGQVPLDNEYQIEVSKDGTTIGGDRVRFTASRTSATIQAGIYDIAVIVKGAAGQPIQGAIVELVRGGTTIATAATDASGSAVFSKVVGADYSVRASYEQFSNSANVARGVRSATIVLDLYTILFGVPMTLATFLALIIGLILLVIVVVVIVSEYIRWRGRRLGIYPAAPPKK